MISCIADLVHQDLRDPRNPARRLPYRLRRLLPDPTREEGRSRYLHHDLNELPLGQLKAERVAVVLGMADLEFENLPAWVLEREAQISAEISRRLSRPTREMR